MRLRGTGKWDGRPGYTFEAVTSDRGEPGRHLDTLSLMIKSPAGAVVAQLDDDLDGGNIQSTRLRLWWWWAWWR